MIDDTRSKPIFVQIAEQIENQILNGTLQEGQKIPSQVDFAKQFAVNPLTVGKGVQILEDFGIVSKKRGLGMFVLPEAKSKIYEFRRNQALVDALDELVGEADALALSDEEVFRLFRERRNHAKSDNQ